MGKVEQGLVDGIDGGVEGGSTRGEADGFVAEDPVGVELIGGSDMVDRFSSGAAEVDELAGVVGVAPADDNHGLGALEEPFEGALMFLGGLADGVDGVDFGFGVFRLDGFNDTLHLVQCGRGLADNAEAGDGVGGHFVDGFDHDESIEVFDDTLDFDVASAANHEDEEAIGVETLSGLMDAGDEGAGGVDQALAGGLQSVSLAIADAVGGDQDEGGFGELASIGLAGHGEALRFELEQDLFVVHDLTVDGDVGGFVEVVDDLQCVADAEAHPQDVSPDHVHDHPLKLS